jgi:hypothetical protein
MYCNSDIFTLLTAIVASQFVVAQLSPPPPASPPTLTGELIVIRGWTPNEYEDESITVTLKLNGVVYDEDGIYNTSISPGHSQYSVWNSKKLHGSTGSLNYEGFLQWESVYEGDDNSSSYDCLGMLGWGDYALEFSIDGHTEEFLINTIDGNWMEPILGPLNKIHVAVALVVDNGNLDFKFYVYHGSPTYDWVEYDNDEAFGFWHLTGGRNRSSIGVLDDEPFLWKTSDRVQMDLDHANVDHHVLIDGGIEILESRSIRFTDWFDGTFNPTVITCNNQIEVSGTLLAGTENDASGYISVVFTPQTVKPEGSARRSWEEIIVRRPFSDTTTVAVDVSNISISNARFGIWSENNAPIAIRKSVIHRCAIGIQVRSTKAIIGDSEIGYCGSALFLAGDLNRYGPSRVTNCELFASYPSGEAKGSIGSGIYILGHYEDITSTGRPESQLFVHATIIRDNWAHGITNYNARLALVECEIIDNGYPHGMEYWELGPLEKKDGVWLWDGWAIVHKCHVANNSAYGLHANYDFITCATVGLLTNEEANVNYTGENCIENNGVNLGSNYRGQMNAGIVFMPHPGEGENDLINHRNTLKNPKQQMPSGAPKHLTVNNDSKMFASGNYFYPWADDCFDIGQQGGGTVIITHRILNPSLAVCATQASPSGIEIDSYRDEDVARALLHHSKTTCVDSAMLHATRAMGKQLTLTDAFSATAVLKS